MTKKQFVAYCQKVKENTEPPYTRVSTYFLVRGHVGDPLTRNQKRKLRAFLNPIPKKHSAA